MARRPWRGCSTLIHITFDARVETKNEIYVDGRAASEWNFCGQHIGEFAGIPATGKEVRVPMCVIYDLEDDKIKRRRVDFETPALLLQ